MHRNGVLRCSRVHWGTRVYLSVRECLKLSPRCNVSPSSKCTLHIHPYLPPSLYNVWEVRSGVSQREAEQVASTCMREPPVLFPWHAIGQHGTTINSWHVSHLVSRIQNSLQHHYRTEECVTRCKPCLGWKQLGGDNPDESAVANVA